MIVAKDAAKTGVAPHAMTDASRCKESVVSTYEKLSQDNRTTNQCVTV